MRARWALLVATAAVLAALLLFGTRRVHSAPAAIAAVTAAEANHPSSSLAPAPRPRATEDPPPDRIAAHERGLARAEQTLDAYLTSTRYPPWSRPLGERPDMVNPHHVSAHRLPLAQKGAGEPGTARVLLQQDRYYASAGEVVTLGIACEMGASSVPCQLVSASAETGPDMPPVAGAPFAITFTEAAGGALEAHLQPSAMGFAAYHGSIRVTAQLRIGREEGSASFDFDYTPEAPATFTGTFRESLVEGSLDLYAAVDVKQPGRYVIRARVEDESGKRFAFVSASEQLRAGNQEVRLRLFGKLVGDEDAESPFRLRDLEGFRLMEDVYPDRETMPGLDGIVYTTRRYEPRDFSTAEWDSPEKARHVAALTGDVDRARSRGR
jgi:hypothetical protein